MVKWCKTERAIIGTPTQDKWAENCKYLLENNPKFKELYNGAITLFDPRGQ